MKHKSLILIGSFYILLQTNLFSQDTIFNENFESYSLGPLAIETESPWVQLQIGRNANVSAYWVHSGDKNFEINSYTTTNEIDYVKLNFEKKPAQLNLVLWYTPDGYFDDKDFAEIGLGFIYSKFEFEAISGFWGKDHIVYYRDTVMNNTIKVFNELEYGVGPADFNMGIPKHNYFRVEFDFNNSQIDFFIGTDLDAPLRNTFEFDGTMNFNVLYIVGGINPTYIDDICISTIGTYDPQTPIHNFSNKEQFQFYPNPANNVLYFKETGNGNTEISILSIDGKLLKQIKREGVNQIDINDIHQGVYLIRMMNANNIMTKKLIIQR